MKMRWRRQNIFQVRPGDIVRFGVARWDHTGLVRDRVLDPVNAMVEGHLVTPAGRLVGFAVRDRGLQRCQRLVPGCRSELASALIEGQGVYFVGIGSEHQPTGWLTVERTIVKAGPGQLYTSLEDAALSALWAKGEGYRSFIESWGDSRPFTADGGGRCESQRSR